MEKESQNIVKVYSTPQCPWCHKAKDFLKTHKIDFQDFDVSKNREAAQEMVKFSGQMGVPVLNINEELVVGFDENRIRDLLKIK